MYAEDEIDIEELPVNGMIVPLRKRGLGSVPGLDDEELADPAELERVIFIEEWRPILQLPKPIPFSGVPKQMEKVFTAAGVERWVDVSAFNTMDFHRR